MKTAEEAHERSCRKLIEYGKNYTEYKPVHDELKKLQNGWTSKRDKYEEAHRAELDPMERSEPLSPCKSAERDKDLAYLRNGNRSTPTLRTGRGTAEYAKLKDTRAEVAELHKIRKCVDIALRTPTSRSRPRPAQSGTT